MKTCLASDACAAGTLFITVIALSFLGLAVAGILYWWEERRFKRQKEKAFFYRNREIYPSGGEDDETA